MILTVFLLMASLGLAAYGVTNFIERRVGWRGPPTLTAALVATAAVAVAACRCCHV